MRSFLGFCPLILAACGLFGVGNTPSASVTGGDGGDEEASDEAASDESEGESGDIDAGDACGPACSIWGEPSCSEGEKCTTVACDPEFPAQETVCRSYGGEGAAGDECQRIQGEYEAGHDDCGEGKVCLYIDEGTELGTCVAFCSADEKGDLPCAACSSCASTNTPWGLCSPECDPLAQDCLNQDDVCGYWPSEGRFDCFIGPPDIGAPYGTPCDYIVGCDGGLTCVDAGEVPEASCEGSAGCCSPYCDMAEAESCPGLGQVCDPLFEPDEPTTCYSSVGVCRVL